MKYKSPIMEHVTRLLPIPTSLEPRIEANTNFKSLLFDIYGTLFISGSGDIGITRKKIQTSPDLKKLLKSYHISFEVEYLLERFHAAIEAKHQQMRKNGIEFPEVQIDSIWSEVLNISDSETIRKFAIEYEMIMNPVFPMPGLENLLSACRNKGIIIGIISNAQFYTPLLFDSYLDLSVEQLGFQSDLTLFSYQSGFAKPSIDLFITARERLLKMGIRETEILYLGNDMLNDIFPAKAAGLQTALFAGDLRSLRLRADHPECKIKPDLVITELQQLTDLILNPQHSH